MTESEPALSPAIILVRPQMGENIGAAARAMLNFGISDLRLVAPRDGWPNQRAIDMSAGAFDSMPAPTLYETLADASSDLQALYATTARSRDIVKPVLKPDSAAVQLMERRKRVGFVFGPERSGLENADISLCDSIINVPTNPEFSSINLGQSVLLIAYAYSNALRNSSSSAAGLITAESNAAKLSERNAFLDRLEDELERGRFFQTPDLRPTVMRNIRAIFSRADLTDQEVRTLHGVVSALIGKKKQ